MIPLSDKVGRLFKIGLPGTILDDETKRVLETVKPLSVILFGRNIQDPEQLARLIADITSFTGYKPVFAIDQEGGIVTRLVNGFTGIPGPMALSATGKPGNAYTAARILGQEMKAVGIDWDLAPVVDININPENRAIGVRSFSSELETVIEYAKQFLKGLRASGIVPCLKHFPGLGAVKADPHIDLPVLNSSRQNIYDNDLQPFLRLKAECWMPTHLYVPALQTRREAVTVSREVLTDLVRGELHFEGVLVADDLNMGGISKGSPIEKIVIDAFSAGMDILSICEGTEKQIRAKDSLLTAIKENETLQKRLMESLKRIDDVFGGKKRLLKQNLRQIGTNKSAHLSAAISLQSIKTIKEEEPFPGLAKVDAVFTMAVSRLVLIEDNKQGIPEAVRETALRADCPLYLLPETMNAEAATSLVTAARGRVILLFTENAYFSGPLCVIIEKIAEASKSLHLVALRNPFDADIKGVKNAVCSYGYTKEQQKALLKFLNSPSKSNSRENSRRF